MEPEFTCPAIQEHKAFHSKLENLESYLLDVLGHEKIGHFETKPSPGKKKIPYESAKLKGLMEELADPLFAHVRFIPIRVVQSEFMGATAESGGRILET